MKSNPEDKPPIEIKSGRSSIKSFLRREDDQKIKDLKSRYQQTDKKTGIFTRLKHKLFPSLSDINYTNEKIEKLIDFQKSSKRYPSIKAAIQSKINERLYVKYKGRMVYFWETKAFKEAAFLHFPRIIFLIFTCYIITQIKINKESQKQNQSFVRSYRQEDADRQISQINKVLGANENTFEPGKKPQFNREYDPTPRKTKAEIELEDELFKLYEDLEDDYGDSIK